MVQFIRNVGITYGTVITVAESKSDFKTQVSYVVFIVRILEKNDGVIMAPRCILPGPRFNIKMSSYRYRKSHYGDKTILRPSYLHNGISYTGKTTSLY